MHTFLDISLAPMREGTFLRLARNMDIKTAFAHSFVQLK